MYRVKTFIKMDDDIDQGEIMAVYSQPSRFGCTHS